MELPKYFYFRVRVAGIGGVELEDASDVDVAEVVRCKDCKWYEESKNPEMSSLRFCYRLRNDSGVRVGYNWDGNDFCSYGERREDETD